MKVAYATLGGSPDRNDDRIFITDNAVVVMDGASAFMPSSVDTGTYVDTLGAAIVDELRDQTDLHTAVGNAITTTAAELDLEPGESPSSTVSVVRVNLETVDVFVLGDTPVVLGLTDGTLQHITDDRIHQIPTPAGDAYRARLAAGHGFDDEHRRLLAELQKQQRAHRNTERGYWIAEAEPAAARHAIAMRLDRKHLSYAVLGTDGAERALSALGIIDWYSVITKTSDGLLQLLREARQWEATTDPDARLVPRAKRHDDKSIAVLAVLK